MTTKEKIANYPSTDLFHIKDTIGVPHPFMVGSKHVTHAADHHCGILGDETMKEVQCATPGCTLDYEEHETALLVAVNSDLELSELGAEGEPLNVYLNEIKDQCEADGFAGFAFIKDE